MSAAMLRSWPLLLAAILFLSPSDSFGRGPGGRGGGPGGGRAAGGRNGQTHQLAQPKLKKKTGPQSGPLGDGPQNGPKLVGAGDKLGSAAPKLQGHGPGTFAGGLQDFPGNIGELQDRLPGREKFSNDNLASRGGQAQQNWQSRDGQFQQNAQGAISRFQNGPQPFTAQWYADHPNAWQYTHPHADAWAAATATGVAAWLGWAAYDDYTPAYGTTYSTTYVAEQPADESYEDAADSTDDQAAADESAGVQNDAGEWLALGVYSVQSANGEPTSRYLQLAVNREGELRGVYYDEISGSSQNLSGQVDQATRVATWSPDSNRKVTFRANLSDLTQQSGTIKVSQPAGKQRWRINRLDQTGQ